MNTEELKKFLVPYLESITYKKSKMYVCPLCHSGEGKKGTPAFSIVPNTNESQWKCHSCGEGGDVIDLYQKINNTDFKEAVNELSRQFSNSSYIPPETSKKRKEEQAEDLSDFFFKAYQDVFKSNYLYERGIKDIKLIEKFQIGYVPDWRHPKVPNAPSSPRVIIPTSKYSYLARDTRPNLTGKAKQYSKQKVGATHIFNINAIYDEKYDYCFIVEGEIDCLSVLQCGYNCIGLGSLSMMRSLLNQCKIKPKSTLIVALDNDNAGKKAEKHIPSFLEKKIPCITANISGTEKDANDLLVKAPEQLKANLQKAVEQAHNFKMSEPEESEDFDTTGQLTIHNLTIYLKAKNISVKYNEITHDIEYSGITGESKEHIKENITALIYDELRFILKKCTMENIGAFLNVIATRNKYNPILEKIQGVKWDGKSRLNEIYKMFQIDDSDKLSRIILKKWFMQCICGLHNTLENPYSLDIVLVFQGEQGIGKTRFFEHLAINNNYFGEGKTIDPRDKDTKIQATSKWICELGEIGSTMKKDIDSLKAFLTSSTDEYRLPYGRTALKYPRLTSFCGTTNDKQFLIDETGNRRFATVPLKPTVYIDYVKQVKPFDTLQFWAEINQIVEDSVKNPDVSYGSCFRFTREELAELNKRNKEFEKPLKAEQEVYDVISEQSTPENGYTVEMKYMTVTEFITHNIILKKYDARTVGKVLEKYGYKQESIRINGIPKKVRFLPFKYFSAYPQ